MKEIKNFINGEFITNLSGKTFEKRTPIDNSLIGKVYEAGQAEVNDAVAAARAALKGPWGQLSVVERVNLLDAVANEINRRFDDFLEAEIADTGKPHSLASHVDIPRGAANFKIFADTIKNASTESFEMRTPDGRTARSYGVRVPRGVIAVNRMPLAPSGRTSRAVIAAGVTSPKSSTVAAVARARQACAQGWSALITA